MTPAPKASESRTGPLRLRGSGLLRASVALAVAVVLYLTGDAGGWAAYLVAALAVLYGVVLAARSGYDPGKGDYPAAAFGDAILISLLVAATGGVGSPFSGLYLLAALGMVEGGRFASPAAASVAGYLAAIAVPVALAGARPSLVSAPLLAAAGLQIALVLLAFYLAAVLGSRLRVAREESAAREVSLASEKSYAERLETAISRIEQPLGLLRPEDVLQWTVETAREATGAAYVHAALLEGNLHRTAAGGKAESWPSWWHPEVQRLVLRSSRSGKTLREKTSSPGIEEMIAIPLSPDLSGEGPGAGALLAGGEAGRLGGTEERVLDGIARETARALSGRSQAPGGRDPVSGLPNHASLARVLQEEWGYEGSPTLLRVGLDGFGRYCEVHGLAAGEDLLRRIGDRTSAGQHRAFQVAPGEISLLVGGNESRVRRAIQGVRETVRDTAAGASVPLVVRAGVAPAAGPRSPEETLHEAVSRTLDEAGRALERARREPEGVAYATEAAKPETADPVDPVEGARSGVSTPRGVVSALVGAAEAHDAYLGEHLHSVSRLARSLGEELCLSPPRLEVLTTGALLHDVGKIGLPQELLQKPGSLTPGEYEEIKRHPELGVEILEPVESLSGVLPIVKSHHERYDGRGYPEGLSAEEIPLEARITLVADALDSMTRDRAYREGTTLNIATSEITAGSGSQFDPEVVSALLSLLESGGDGIRLAT